MERWINDSGLLLCFPSSQEYVDYNGGAGVQHIALKTEDIITAVRTLCLAQVPSGLLAAGTVSADESSGWWQSPWKDDGASLSSPTNSHSYPPPCWGSSFCRTIQSQGQASLRSGPKYPLVFCCVPQGTQCLLWASVNLSLKIRLDYKTTTYVLLARLNMPSLWMQPSGRLIQSWSERETTSWGKSWEVREDGGEG